MIPVGNKSPALQKQQQSDGRDLSLCVSENLTSDLPQYMIYSWKLIYLFYLSFIVKVEAVQAVGKRFWENKAW